MSKSGAEGTENEESIIIDNVIMAGIVSFIVLLSCLSSNSYKYLMININGIWRITIHACILTTPFVRSHYLSFLLEHCC